MIALPPVSIGEFQDKVMSDPDTELERFCGALGARIPAVVVVADVVVVAVVVVVTATTGVTDTREFPTMSGCPTTGPNILGNH